MIRARHVKVSVVLNTLIGYYSGLDSVSTVYNSAKSARASQAGPCVFPSFQNRLDASQA